MGMFRRVIQRLVNADFRARRGSLALCVHTGSARAGASGLLVRLSSFLRAVNWADLTLSYPKNLRGRQSLDYEHGAAAAWATPRCVLNGRRSGRGRRYGSKECSAKRKEFAAPPVCQPAEVADAREPLRQNMLQEATQELFERECHGSVFAVMGVVLPAKRHLSVVD